MVPPVVIVIRAILSGFPGPPMQSASHSSAETLQGLSTLLSLDGYLELVDWSARILREERRGAIDEKLRPILDRLQIDPRHWLYFNKTSKAASSPWWARHT
ncbi:hypothetical protein [Microbulbifer halophilus]|uniref:hypothetical protein n=1 Tax=Microbulbifer halophilus TaxID=453963 RepID=UPI0036226A47